MADRKDKNTVADPTPEEVTPGDGPADDKDVPEADAADRDALAVDKGAEKNDAHQVDLDFGIPEADVPNNGEKKPLKKQAMNLTRKIAYSATCAAIGIVALIIAFFVPLTMPYIVAGVALYICLSKCGFKFGALTYVAVAGAGLLINIVSALPFVFLFGLQPFISFGMVKLKNKLKKDWIYWVVRVIAVTVFFNVAFFGIYSLASNTMFDIGALEAIMGGYLLLAIVGSVVFILYDIATMIITSYIVQVLKF